MILKNSKILVVAAHPDDDILGCGGTLAKAISLNATVKILFLGRVYPLVMELAQKIQKKLLKLAILGMKNVKDL